MAKRSDLFWGLVIGLLGNLLVSTAFALVEHPEWAPYLNPFYIFSWIAFVLFCSLLLLKKDECKKVESEKLGKVKKQGKEKPTTESLIAEYQVLNDSVNRRYRDMLLVESIMIPSTLTIVVFAVIYRNDFGMNFLSLPNSGFVPLIGAILLGFLGFLRWTTNEINDISFERQRAIEKELHIKGHQYIRERTHCKTRFKIRRRVWYLIFVLLIGAYLFTMWWLFRETVIPPVP